MINIFDKEFRNLDDLIGLTVLKIEINLGNDKLFIKLKDSFGNEVFMVFDSFGDCCSTSWIESLEGDQDIIGNEIINIIEHELPPLKDDDPDFMFDNNFTQICNYEIVTAKGSCVIDFRNLSNGYYGGSLDLRESSIVKTKSSDISAIMIEDES